MQSKPGVAISIKKRVRPKRQRQRHIIRFREDADQVTASKFVWDILLFGAQALNDAGR